MRKWTSVNSSAGNGEMNKEKTTNVREEECNTLYLKIFTFHNN